MSTLTSQFKYVKYFWDDAFARDLDPVARLVYRSNLLGSDQRITNTGGGNTSSKIMESDPLTKQSVEILWVKGSGGDLRTSTRENFASLYQEKLLSLQPLYLQSNKRGPKTEAEDAMVGLYAHCTFNLNPRAPSIDTPLHSFIPFKHVDHMHPNAVIAIAAARNAKELTREIYGDGVLWIPWQRPGFDLGLKLQEICRENQNIKGVVLGQHGLINWANDDRECYELTLELIERAAEFIEGKAKGKPAFGGRKVPSLGTAERRKIFVRILPWLRGQVSREKRMIGTIQDDEPTRDFVNSKDASRLAELGTSCPDHFLRTKIKPLYVDWNPQKEDVEALRAKLGSGIEKYRKDYADYYNRCRHSGSPAMRDTNPTVVLVPGVGMITWGKDKSESRVTAEFYTCAIDVMRGAETIDEYIALPQQEAFDIEYWLLEEAKLRRMPPEKELARKVIAIVGAGSGIGKVTAQRLVGDGAHIVCVDLDQKVAEATSEEILKKAGRGIGVGGSGISACGPAIGLAGDVTQRASVRAMLEETTLAYGGLDALVITAGIFVPPDISGNIPDDQWQNTFAINVTGAYVTAQEAATIWREQGLDASVVLTTSVNAVVVKKGSVAYDTSKAAANHLVRELAVELAPLVRVNAVAPATVIEGSSMFPRNRTIASLEKYKIPYSVDESDESLRSKLAEFYAGRTLIRKPITTADQAEAVFLLLSNRLGKTTGQIITVDGGLSEAFLR
ncbi:MAG: bifunctional rhamnulose-1-phosphate aldolase/short-chain dehydrogenase [Ignavibacteriales bacterium]|nr:bifunctional rhamnulose-1-phosphate aldolase/short-chain dehydrogenase [Ignavibacteriales bacterium]